jgi:hypothetical protein
LAATNPPGWRRAALDHESCDPILIQAPADLISSKDATFPGTAAEAGDSAEEIRMQRTTTDPLSLPNRDVAGKQSACEAINVPKTSAGNQISTRVPTVSKPPDLAQKPSRNTLTSASSAYKALNTVRYGDITPGADHRDADGDQRHHVTGTSNANATHMTYEGDEEDQNQEEGKGTGEKEGEERDRVYESEQENTDESEDEDGDDGDGEDEENEENAKKCDDKERRGVEDKSELVSEVNNQGQQKRDGHMISTGRSPLPVGALNSDKEALNEVIEVRHDTRSSTDAARQSDSTLPTAPEQRSDRPTRAVREGKCLDVHAGQPVAGPDGTETVSARSSPRSRRSSGLITESFTGISTANGHVDADDSGSTSSDNSSLSTEREFDADDNNHHTQRWAQARKFTRYLPRPCQGWQQGLAIVNSCKDVSGLNILART